MLTALAAPHAAAAGCSTSTNAGASGDAFYVGATEGDCSGAQPTAVSTSNSTEGHIESFNTCTIGGTDTCIGDVLICDDGSPMMQNWFYPDNGDPPTYLGDSCPEDAVPIPAGPTLADIQNAFRSIPMQPSVLQVQPPGGETLVNFRTNFFTVNDPFERTVTLLGARVDFRIRASEFTWHFGDGSTRTTSKPGAPYPELDVTHTYARKGPVTPRVDTTYTADYRVDGGPWSPVGATVTIEGAPVPLTIREARPVLVG